MNQEPFRIPAARARRVGTTRDVLGECPVWSVADRALYWIDIRQPQIRRHRPASGETESWPLPEMVGAIALAGPERLVVALGGRIALFDVATGDLRTVAELPHRPPGHRFNDGRCDPDGRFWISTMHNDTRGPEGTLFRLDRGGLTPVLGDIRIPNSLAWSPDGGTMYFADSLDHEIGAFAFNRETGTLGARRTLSRTEAPAFPDGSTVDREGRIWNAEFHGGCVRCWRADGGLAGTAETPTGRPTSCAFGGDDLATLFVTTTSQNMSEREREADPLAGALLAFDVGTGGLAEPVFDAAPFGGRP